MQITFDRFKSSIAAFISVIFLYSTVAAPVAEANFWQDRRKAVEANQQINPEQNTQFAQLPTGIADLNNALPRVTNGIPSLQKIESLDEAKIQKSSSPDFRRLPKWLSSLPSTYGDIQKINLVPQADKRPLVVLVQDAHEIYSAQLNIANMLGHLQSAADELGQGNLLFAMEGSAGAYDFAPYRKCDIVEHRKVASDFLLSHKLLSGPEVFGITAKNVPMFWGVETPNLYIENVEAYRASLPKTENFKNAVYNLEFALKPIKDRYYTLELWALDENLNSYHKGELDVLHYVKFLSGQAGDLASFPEVKKLLEVLSMEESLDFKAVESERAQLIQVLSQKLDKQALNELLQYSLAYRAGQVTYGQYYAFLQTMSESHGVKLENFQNFNRYIHYVLKAEAIEKYALFEEIESLKDAVIARLGKTKEQKELLRISEDIKLLSRLQDFQFGPAAWKNYQAHRSEIVNLPARIEAFGAKLSVDADLKNLLPLFEHFYAAADKRNNAMVSNLLEKANETRSSAMVLVAGGFHTPVLESLLKSKGISVVTLTPKIGAIDKNTHALDLFAMQHIPLEKMLLGEKLDLRMQDATVSRQNAMSIVQMPDPKPTWDALEGVLEGAKSAQVQGADEKVIRREDGVLDVVRAPRSRSAKTIVALKTAAAVIGSVAVASLAYLNFAAIQAVVINAVTFLTTYAVVAGLFPVVIVTLVAGSVMVAMVNYFTQSNVPALVPAVARQNIKRGTLGIGAKTATEIAKQKQSFTSEDFRVARRGMGDRMVMGSAADNELLGLVQLGILVRTREKGNQPYIYRLADWASNENAGIGLVLKQALESETGPVWDALNIYRIDPQLDGAKRAKQISDFTDALDAGQRALAGKNAILVSARQQIRRDQYNAVGVLADMKKLVSRMKGLNPLSADKKESDSAIKEANRIDLVMENLQIKYPKSLKAGQAQSIPEILSTMGEDDVNVVRRFSSIGLDPKLSGQIESSKNPSRESKALLDGAIDNRLSGKIVDISLRAGIASRMALLTRESPLHLLSLRKLMTEDINLYSDEIKDFIRELRRDHPEYLELEDIPFGARVFIAYMLELEELVRVANARAGFAKYKLADVMANQKFIIHVNEATGRSIIQQIMGANFYGFNPDNVVFMVQDVYNTWNYDPATGEFTKDATHERPFGHGQLPYDQVTPGLGFTMHKTDTGYVQVNLQEDSLAYMQGRGAETFSVEELADLNMIDRPLKLDQDIAALTMFKKGFNLVGRVAENKTGQKGGYLLETQDGRQFIGEGPLIAHSDYGHLLGYMNFWGYRGKLSEVSQALRQSPGAVYAVDMRENSAGQKRLAEDTFYSNITAENGIHYAAVYYPDEGGNTIKNKNGVVPMATLYKKQDDRLAERERAASAQKAPAEVIPPVTQQTLDLAERLNGIYMAVTDGVPAPRVDLPVLAINMQRAGESALQGPAGLLAVIASVFQSGDNFVRAIQEIRGLLAEQQLPAEFETHMTALNASRGGISDARVASLDEMPDEIEEGDVIQLSVDGYASSSSLVKSKLRDMVQDMAAKGAQVILVTRSDKEKNELDGLVHRSGHIIIHVAGANQTMAEIWTDITNPQARTAKRFEGISALKIMFATELNKTIPLGDWSSLNVKTVRVYCVSLLMQIFTTFTVDKGLTDKIGEELKGILAAVQAA